MAEQQRKNPLGATGTTVAVNVKRLRESQNLGYADLSRRLADMQRPIATLGLSRIESGDRRVDADDLVALAAALKVSPATLLMPNTENRLDLVTATSIENATAERLWNWITAGEPLEDWSSNLTLWIEFAARAFPWWRAEQAAEGIRDIAALDRGGAAAETVKRKYDSGRAASDGDD